MQVDDSLICKMLAEHDSRGMEGMFKHYYRPLVLWADSVLGDISVAEDVVQDFFLDFWEKELYKRVNAETLRGYVFTAIRNRALKILEKRDPLRGALKILPQEIKDSEMDWCREEALQAVEAEIEKLPSRTKEVLQAVYIEGLSYRETAEKLGISVSTVKTLLVNVLKYLRKEFSGYMLLSLLFCRS